MGNDEGFRWSQLGFSRRPYDTRPLGGDEDSRELLVGREGQRTVIRDHLNASSLHLTIDGPNGGGKTSLMQCFLGELDQSAQRYSQGELLLPIKEPVNLSKGESPAEFEERMLLVLGSALAQNKDLIRRAGNSPGEHLADLDRFINSPVLRGAGAGVNIAGFGGTGSRSPALNSEFKRLGLERLVHRSLREAFPADEAGALVVCVDNTESLKTPAKARDFMDAVRDSLLNLQGVRWVFLGADGILDGLNNHPRLDGVLTAPLQLSDLSPVEAAEAVERRINLYRIGDVTVPVNGEGFQHIYESCGRHLRTALGICGEFALEAAARGLLAGGHLVEEPVETNGERWTRWELPSRFIKTYVNEQSLNEWHRVVKMGASATSVLRDLEGPEPKSKEELGVEAQPRKAALKRLRDKDLIVGVRSKEDRRRVQLQLSAKGMLAATGGRLAS